MTGFAAGAALSISIVALGGCAQFVQYTGELVDSNTGRTPLVTVPASVGSIIGFLGGLPLDILALPITYPVYLVQKNQNPITADAVSTMFFPSFVMWRAGTLVALPLDMIEFGVYRAWLPEPSPNEEEQRQVEFQIDQDTLPRYPVKTVYPKPGSGKGEGHGKNPGSGTGQGAR